MKVLPTLNIQNGHLAPLFPGAQPSRLSPHDAIEALLDMDCCRFALVDVDAARGIGCNREVIDGLIRRIRRSSSKVCIQVGGGIRSSDHAQHYLNLGATWLLVGTALHRYPVVVDQMLARFQDHLMASLDAKAGEVRIDGRLNSQGVGVVSLADSIRRKGFRRLLFTDIPATEAAEPDFHTARQISAQARIPVFMGGSIRTQAHLSQAGNVRGLHGVFLDAVHLLDSPGMITPSAQPC